MGDDKIFEEEEIEISENALSIAGGDPHAAGGLELRRKVGAELFVGEVFERRIELLEGAEVFRFAHG